MAKKLKPIAKTVHVGKVLIIKLATKVTDMVYEQTVFKHKGADNKKFKPYSAGYKKKKAGMSTGGIAGQPDLVLSGKMMNSLLVVRGSATKDNVVVGWVNPESAQKLVWNASTRGKKRRITKKSGTFPFAKTAERPFKKGIDKKLNKNVKLTSERITFDIKM